MGEIWKDVVGYEGYYQVSNLGRVKRCRSVVKSCLKHLNGTKIVKERICGQYLINKYSSVHLCKNGIGKYWRVHRLVAMAFISNLDNLPQINHKDENKLNNRVDNLEWCTCKYNQNYGTRKYKREHTKTKEIQKIDANTGEVLETYFSLTYASKINNLSFKAVSRCALSLSKTCGGYKWKYVKDLSRNT